MKKSTQKRLQRKQNNLPGMFVDSSVFLELLLGQPKHEECLSFFTRARYKYRLATSVLALGEVIDTLSTIEESNMKEKSLIRFSELLAKGNMAVYPISRVCLKNNIAVMESDEYLDSHDSLIFSSAFTENFKMLVTLDSDFTKQTGSVWHLKVKQPKEA